MIRLRVRVAAHVPVRVHAYLLNLSNVKSSTLLLKGSLVLANLLIIGIKVWV